MPLHVRLALAQIKDARAAKTDVTADQRLHAVPKLQRLDDQRQLARVAAHSPHPAPIAARLFGAETALLANGDRDALARKKQGGAESDDPAADDHDVGRAG